MFDVSRSQLLSFSKHLADAREPIFSLINISKSQVNLNKTYTSKNATIHNYQLCNMVLIYLSSSSLIPLLNPLTGYHNHTWIRYVHLQLTYFLQQVARKKCLL